MLKTKTIFLILLIIFSLNINIVLSYSPPNLSVSFDKTILIPGKNNQLYLTIKNIGDATALQIWISISLPSSTTGGTLMILNGSDGRWYIDSLASSESYSIPLDIYVSPSAAGNIYQITITLSYQYYGSKTETRSIGVYVPPLEIQGAILSLSLSPYEINFGRNNNLTLKIKNIGDADAKQVSIALNMPGAGISPLSLVNSDGKWYFDTIKVNEEIEIPITIYASVSSAGQTYQLPITISYSDYIKSKTETKYLTLIVPFSTSPLVDFEINVNPQDLNAGELNKIHIYLYNKGDSDASYVQILLNMPSGLVLKESDGHWLIDKIKSRETIDLEVNIYVSPLASGNTYQIPIIITYYDSLLRMKQETRYISLNVPTVYSKQAVIDIRLNKNELKSGEINNLNLTIKNEGNGIAKSIFISLTIPIQSVILLDSDGNWYIDELKPGESITIPLKLFASPSSSGLLTTFTFSISYIDTNLKSKQQISNIGMIIRGVVDIIVLDSSVFPSQITIGKPFSITVSIINLGTTTAQSVMIYPSESNGLKPVSYDKIFLGDLSVNTPSSFTISYYATNITSGRYILNLEYTYKDNLGQSFKGILNVPVNILISTNTTQVKTSSQFSFNIIYPIIIIIIVIALVVILRKLRK
ncbi:MAG: hypothetical protein LM593_06240 [Candidatus Verstraetearchaeota archaeon]|nr:hypothetical protein [Candidatus Verstraetearchaeota archaeon]